jgi:hypothetical protein
MTINRALVEQQQSMVLYAFKHKLISYIENDLRDYIDKEISRLVEEACKELKIDAHTEASLLDKEIDTIVKVLFNGREL